MAVTKELLKWPCGLPVVYEMTILEPMADLDLVRSMKDVKDAQILKNEVVDGIHHADLAIFSDAKIPMALQNLIKPHMIGWKQFGRWNIKTGEYKVSVEPNFFKDLISISVHSICTPNGPGIDMAIRMETKVDVPILGKLAESVINQKVMESLTTQFKKDIKKIQARA